MDTSTPGPCPYCGADYRPDLQPHTVHWPGDVAGETDATVQLRAQVSTAINTRRIALVLILAIILSVGSALVSLMISVSLIEPSSAIDFLKLWVVTAVFIMIVGLYYIIFDKQLSRLNGPRKSQ